MVKKESRFLISEFAREAGLSVDTVRFYIKRGILIPGSGEKGGRNAYHMFSKSDLEDVQTVEVCQLLGMTLSEIQELLEVTRSGLIRNSDLALRVRKRRAKLMDRMSEIQALIRYLDAKIAWIQKEPDAEQPTFKLPSPTS